jgi:2-polyprenyl-3-methyl-5-hydroxy-6-metoxy-1,4-benzoquinol methylase
MRGHPLASIYEVPVDPEAENNVHAMTLALVGHNKRVLEVGCASGYFTEALTNQGCNVVGIELDNEMADIAEKWAERVVVGDLESPAFWQKLEGEQFDAVTFGDVLEHLRDPLAALRAAVRYLKPSGIVAISVPNVAHGDVRIALLQGKFPYGPWGLLDRTHIRFFTKESLRALVKEAGLVTVETRRKVVPLFQTELDVTRESVDPSTINLILEDPEAETYQFVVKAVLDDGKHALATLSDRVAQLADQAQDEVVRTALIHREMDQLRSENERTRREADDYRQQLEADVYRQQLEAVLNTKTFRMLAPVRRFYGRFHRGPTSSSPEAR